MDHKGSCTNYVIADRIMITVLAELGGKSPPPIAEFFWQIWGVPPLPFYKKSANQHLTTSLKECKVDIARVEVEGNQKRNLRRV